MTREQRYKQRMQALGIYDEIYDPEITTLCQIERELQMAKKAWSKTAPPGGKPSVLDDLYATIQKMRGEVLQHRDALGLTPKGMHRLRGIQEADGPDQKDLIAQKLDRIADSVAGAGTVDDSAIKAMLDTRDAFAGLPDFEEAAAISEKMDAEDYDLKQAVAEDMG